MKKTYYSPVTRFQGHVRLEALAASGPGAGKTPPSVGVKRRDGYSGQDELEPAEEDLAFALWTSEQDN